MSEEENRKPAEDTAGNAAAETGECGAAGNAGQETPEADRQPEVESEPEPKAAETESKKEEKAHRESRKKEKTFTLTREQMEAAELAARQLESVKSQFVRLTAEYDNYRKRTAREKDVLYQDAKADTIKEFLAIYDNLERAVKAEDGSDSPHKKGLEMIFGQYREILKKLGVTEMEALGQPFDPSRHNAVIHVDDESLGENVVTDVFQAGFMLGDRVLRFATVRVAN